MHKEELNKKEKLFCRLYVGTGNPREAALRAGYEIQPEQAGQTLLGRADIGAEIRRLYTAGEEYYRSRACSGYERLAFGSVADAVKLLYTESPAPEALEQMDFFNVSEIRRPKDGAMEIKFFDRLRALEKLEQADESGKQEPAPFYQALEQSAKALQEGGDG